MDFADVIRLIKSGNKMRRIAWQGREFFIYLVNGSEFEVNRATS